jgi:5,10-methylene-tetrahydrofolate dehydrogenase/methenyl tetrahydrofolate cyclohydrolase
VIGPPILGKPVAMLLPARDATVTMCHSRTTDLAAIVRDADVVVAAVGRPAFVRGDWLKPGAVVIDAGYNDGNVGDVAFAEAVDVARLITPVPRGVGPMTIAMLLRQTLDAVEQALRDAEVTRRSLVTGHRMTRQNGRLLPRRQHRSAHRAPRRPAPGGRERHGTS